MLMRLFRRVDQPKCDVLENGPVKKRRFLLDKTNETSEGFNIEISQIMAFELDLALGRIM